MISLIRDFVAMIDTPRRIKKSEAFSANEEDRSGAF